MGVIACASDRSSREVCGGEAVLHAGCVALDGQRDDPLADVLEGGDPGAGGDVLVVSA